MKIQTVIAIVLVLLAVTFAARAQMSGFGEPRIVKIGASARAVLRDWLREEYSGACLGRLPNPPAVCEPRRVFYTGAGLPRGEMHPLPRAVMREIGFVEPGTTYARSGFTVYLISWPRRIILDSVTLEE